LKAETELETSGAAAPSSPPPGPRVMVGETTRQAGMLFSAQTGSMFAGFLAVVVLGRWMSQEEMGRFAFCQSFIIITGLVFEFGVSSAGARLLALSEDRASERSALGALTLMTLAISIAFSLFIAASSVAVDAAFGKDVRLLLVATAALALFQPFQFFIEQACQGLNRIKLLSGFQLLMAGAYLAALAALALAGHLNAGTALGAYFAGMGAAVFWAMARLRPSFRGSKSFVRLALRQTREFGLNLYLARVMGMVSSRADQLVIAYFIPSPAPLGIYSIVQKFSNPIIMLGRSLAMTRFRAFAKRTSVPGRIIRWNGWLLGAAAAGLVVVGPFAIRQLFPKYGEGTMLLVPFALMNLFAGLFQPYNIFLASHGRGADLRNIVFVTSAASLAGLAVAVPRFGIAGAAWVGAAAMALDYLLHLHYYSRFRRSIE